MIRLFALLVVALLLAALWNWTRSDPGLLPVSQVEDREEPALPTPSSVSVETGADPTLGSGEAERRDVEVASAPLVVRVRHLDEAPAKRGSRLVALTRAEVPTHRWFQLSESRWAVDPEYLLTLDPANEAALDSSGCAALEVPNEATWLVAHERDPTGPKFGAVRVDAGTLSAEIELRSASVLRVRVLDSFDRPVPGVPVGLSGFPGPAAGYGVAVTDAEGIARCCSWRERFDEQMRRHYGAPLWPILIIPSEEPVRAEVSLSHDLDEIVEVRLPPTSEVVVRVVGLGADVTGKVAMKPWPKTPGDFSLAEMSSPLARLVHGEARFPWVSLDYRFLLHVWLDGYDGELHLRPTSAKVEGSRQEVVFDAREVMLLEGMVLGPDGRRITKGHVDYSLAGPNWSRGRTGSLDANGRFRILVSPASIPTSLESLKFEHRLEVEPLARVEVRLEGGFRPGSHELGTLRMVTAR